jgi:Na+-transporting NADH:ubiquinone oxidoreductase subunit C
MLGMSLLFIGILATVYRSFEQKIINNETQAYQKQLLSLFIDKIAESDPGVKIDLNNDLQANYQKYVKSIDLSYAGRYGYSIIVNNQIIGYCFDIMGNGLWGSMRMLIAVTPDMNTIINIDVYKQMETPGLGARVTESWFKDQFKDKLLFGTSGILDYSLIPEDQTADSGTQIRQITGASITSNAVLKMIKTEMSQIKETLQLQVK